MENLINYTINPSIILNRVSYKALPIMDDESKKLDLSDSFDLNYQKDKSILLINYKRSISANPAQLFEIEIEYRVIWEVNSIDIENILSDIDDNMRSYLCYTAPAEASLLIANLTKAGCMPPLITPNEYVPE